MMVAPPPAHRRLATHYPTVDSTIVAVEGPAQGRLATYCLPRLLTILRNSLKGLSSRERLPMAHSARHVCDFFLQCEAIGFEKLGLAGRVRFTQAAPVSTIRPTTGIRPKATSADATRNVRFTEGFRTAALCRRAGTGRGAGVRKPRKEETAGRKRRGLAGRDLWGFWGRGRIADVAAGVEGSRCYRQERTRRAFSGARMRAVGVGAAAGESLRRS
jgi:hypothetical protein